MATLHDSSPTSHLIHYINQSVLYLYVKHRDTYGSNIFDLNNNERKNGKVFKENGKYEKEK